MAKDKCLDYVVIIEDDIQFIKHKYYDKKITEYLNTNPDFDVFLIAGNIRQPTFHINKQIYRVIKSWTTTGYIVKKHYYDTLINNIKQGILGLMREPQKHYLYAIDAHWQILQKQDTWTMIIPRTVTQRPDYSDIEGRTINYNHLMLDIKS